MDMTYGINVTSNEDRFVRAAEEGMELTKKVVVPGAFLVDIIPIRTSHGGFGKYNATELATQ